VVSSFAGPDRPIRHRINHLPEPEFVAELKKLGGTPFEVLEHAQLVQLLLPTLRADHRAVEEYKYCAGTPLTCPIYVYGGADDLYVPKDDLEAWKTCTCAPVTIRLFRGDHFYIHGSNSHLMTQLGRDLLADAEGKAT
jgi:surfactin synthase thioesterase subunit